MAKSEQDLLADLTAKQKAAAEEFDAEGAAIEAEVAAEMAARAALQAAEQADLSLIMVLPTDTWESIAARLGVDPAALFAANQGVGGCTTMQSVPVGARLVMPE